MFENFPSLLGPWLHRSVCYRWRCWRCGHRREHRPRWSSRYRCRNIAAWTINFPRQSLKTKGPNGRLNSLEFLCEHLGLARSHKLLVGLYTGWRRSCTDSPKSSNSEGRRCEVVQRSPPIPTISIIIINNIFTSTIIITTIIIIHTLQVHSDFISSFCLGCKGWQAKCVSLLPGTPY